MIPQVARFALLMQEKLDKNKHKESPEMNPDGKGRRWDALSIDWLVMRIAKEYVELQEAILSKEPPEAVAKECADIANFAMMVADNSGGLRPMVRKVDVSQIDLSRFQVILDIDGVMIPYHKLKDFPDSRWHVQRFTEESVRSLNAIIGHYGADIILTSGINNNFQSGDEAEEFFRSRGVKANRVVLGDQADRYEYVKGLLAAGMERYVIIDDECFGYYYSGLVEYKRILQVNSWRCLDYDDVRRVICQFNLDEGRAPRIESPHDVPGIIDTHNMP
jgi:NTP pyrophosphatase (non-canonical NTP hydrolase)